MYGPICSGRQPGPASVTRPDTLQLTLGLAARAEVRIRLVLHQVPDPGPPLPAWAFSQLGYLVGNPRAGQVSPPRHAAHYVAGDRQCQELLAQLGQSREGAVEGLRCVVVRVVDQRDVDVVDFEPPQAGLQGGPDAVAAVVAHPS